MAYIDTWNLYNNSSSIFGRVTVAVAKTAQYILIEDPGVADHATRLTWAKEALRNIESMARKMLWAVISNATVAAAGENCLDSDIQYVVDSSVNTFAILGA